MINRTKLIIIWVTASFAVSGSALAAEHTVDQKGKKFSTSSISVAKGDSINFSNSDRSAHHVFSGDAFVFDSGRIPAGRNFRQLFDKTGAFKIRCKIHPKMKLEVTVR